MKKLHLDKETSFLDLNIKVIGSDRRLPVSGLQDGRRFESREISKVKSTNIYE